MFVRTTEAFACMGANDRLIVQFLLLRARIDCDKMKMAGIVLAVIVSILLCPVLRLLVNLSWMGRTKP